MSKLYFNSNQQDKNYDVFRVHVKSQANNFLRNNFSKNLGSYKLNKAKDHTPKIWKNREIGNQKLLAPDKEEWEKFHLWDL